MMLLRTVVLLSVTACATATAFAQPSGAPQGGQALPGGATSLQETHGDWNVACLQQNEKKVCALTQRQTDRNSRQLLLAVELSAPGAGRAEGTLVLPFGLAILRPVTFQIDEAPGNQILPFRTCLPVGCLVPLSFDRAFVARLKQGTLLTVKAVADDGQETLFRLSLKGFAAAIDRAEALGR